jgi:hypothetical protein
VCSSDLGFGTTGMPIFGSTNNIIKPAADPMANQYGYQNKSKTQVKGAEQSDALAKLVKRRKKRFKAIRFKAPEGFKVRKKQDE